MPACMCSYLAFTPVLFYCLGPSFEQMKLVCWYSLCCMQQHRMVTCVIVHLSAEQVFSNACFFIGRICTNTINHARLASSLKIYPVLKWTGLLWGTPLSRADAKVCFYTILPTVNSTQAPYSPVIFRASESLLVYRLRLSYFHFGFVGWT